SESVPVRRVLRRQCHDIIADDIGRTRVFLGERIVVIENAFLVARQRGQSRRVSQPVDDGAAGESQRKAQAKRQPLLDVTGRSLAGLWREKVEPPQFVVGTKVPPVGAVGPSFPPARQGRLRISSGSAPF